MVILDTNTLIRFFTADDPKKASIVKKLLEEEKEIFIPEVVYPELEYVLVSRYSASRDYLVQSFLFLMSLSNLTNTNIMRQAILLFSKTSLDMADCIVSIYAKNEKLASFDKDLLKTSPNPYWK